MLSDAKDRAILDELQRNAKATTSEIAKRTGIPVTTVHNRIKRLEKDGVVQGYVPVVDHRKLGLGIHALVFVTAQNRPSGGRAVDQEQLAQEALRLPGVERSRVVTPIGRRTPRASARG